MRPHAPTIFPLKAPSKLRPMMRSRNAALAAIGFVIGSASVSDSSSDHSSWRRRGNSSDDARSSSETSHGSISTLVSTGCERKVGAYNLTVVYVSQSGSETQNNRNQSQQSQKNTSLSQVRDGNPQVVMKRHVVTFEHGACVLRIRELICPLGLRSLAVPSSSAQPLSLSFPDNASKHFVWRAGVCVSTNFLRRASRQAIFQIRSKT